MTTPRDDNVQSLDLTLLAIQERFQEEWRAGKRPRLSVYAERYPAYAAALAEMVMRLEADEQPTSPERERRPLEPVPEPLGERFLNGEGARRALEALPGATADDNQLPMVAEQPASYDTRADAPPQTPHDPATGD
jgi:hypothetical protein